MGATMGKSGDYFLDALPSKGTLHVVMLGLDSAGKTTALYRLKFDQYLNTVPTIGFNCEKVQGTVGKAKGVQFLVWDVGGQEKLRPLWRSYTRCTDGILFVIDSVDIERMEEAKMELMRTAKCPDNQINDSSVCLLYLKNTNGDCKPEDSTEGVPVLILANKQDLPGARDPKELEKLLGLQELLNPSANLTTIASNSTSTGNSSSYNSSNSYVRSLTPTSQNNKFGYGIGVRCSSITKELSTQFPTLSSTNTFLNTAATEQYNSGVNDVRESNQTHTPQSQDFICGSTSSTVATTPIVDPNSSLFTKKLGTSGNSIQFKGWHIQPACAITGEGLQEGLEALYELILKRRKLNKAYKKKR